MQTPPPFYIHIQEETPDNYNLFLLAHRQIAYTREEAARLAYQLATRIPKNKREIQSACITSHRGILLYQAFWTSNAAICQNVTKGQMCFAQQLPAHLLSTL